MEGFNGLRFVALMLAALSVCRAEFEVVTKFSRTEGYEGDPFEATCHVTNNVNTQYHMVWVKKIGAVEEDIATNNNVNEPFASTGRFVASSVIHEPRTMKNITFKLTISGLKGADAGEIGCKVPKQNLQVFKSLMVYVPVSSVRLSSSDPGETATTYSEGREATFEEGEKHDFSCTVSGSYPEPLVGVYVGDLNITQQFRRNVEVEVEGGDQEVKTRTYKVELTSLQLAIDYKFSGNNFTCVAVVPGAKFDPVSVGFPVRLTGYKPKFLCSQTYMTGVHQKNVTVTCVVRAEPAADDFSVTWNRKSGGGNITLTTDTVMEDGHYRAEILPGDDEFEVIMMLHIDRVYIQHFRKYFFMAENALGREVHEIELQQDPTWWENKEPETISHPSKHMTQGASTLAISYFMSALMVAILIV